MIAYTYNISKDVTSNPGSSAYSAWVNNLDPFNLNDPQLSHSNFAVPHRVVGSLSYRLEYLKNLATTFSIFYEGAAQGRYSVAYSNDMNDDGGYSDLIYVPESASELNFVDVYDDGQLVMSAAEQTAAFQSYIDGDSYLNSRKGKYAERFGKVRPWKNRWDVKILQDIFTNFGTDRRYTLQLSLDIVNAGNLLNSDWGVYTRSGLSNRYSVIMPLRYMGRDANNEPTFKLNADDVADFNSMNREINELSTSSTWGMLFGVRLLF
jgi:hypothetical protein